MSSDRKVNQDKFKDSCQDLYIHLLDKMTWMSITPTLHKLLAHAPQLVKHNGGRGLKRLSEEGLESNNKRLRTYRITLSRKMSQKANLEDCLTRLWIGSDPAVGAERAKGRPFCEECLETGHTQRSCATKHKMSSAEVENVEVNSFFE